MRRVVRDHNRRAVEWLVHLSLYDDPLLPMHIQQIPRSNAPKSEVN